MEKYCYKCGAKCDIIRVYADEYLNTDIKHNETTGQRLVLDTFRCPKWRWWSSSHANSVKF